MKKCVVIIIMFFFAGCMQKSSEVFYSIVNDHFASFTDSALYNFGTLFVIPNDTTTINRLDGKIEIDTVLGSDERLAFSLNTVLEKLGKQEFLGMTSSKQKLHLDLGKFPEMEKLKLIPKGTTRQLDTSVIGRIWFSDFSFLNDKAILIVSRQSSPKSGASNGYLFRRQGKKWNIDTVIELERW